MSLHGVRVLDTLDRLAALAVAKRAELLVIAIPSASGEAMRRIVAACAATGLDYKIVPSAHDMMSAPTGRDPAPRSA